MGAVTDLTAAADVLGRAADRLKKLAAEATNDNAWYADGWNVRMGSPAPSVGTVEVLSATQAPSDAALAACLGPHAVAALVPALRWGVAVASGGSDPSERRAVRYLVEFARRVLHEEEE